MNPSHSPATSDFAISQLRYEFKDFSRQEAPEKNWWIFERNIGTGVNERIVVSVTGVTGMIRLVPQAGIYFEEIAKIEAAIWNDPSRTHWWMSAGLLRSMAELSTHRGVSWCAATESEMHMVVRDIRTTYEQTIAPLFNSLTTVHSVCKWFDLCQEEAEKYAAHIVYATFNLVAQRPARAMEIARECERKLSLLQPSTNELTMKNRRQLIDACNRIELLSVIH
jgi:hypothetical protein